MIIDEETYLAHYGTLHKSGRYPWGSGDVRDSQRSKDFLGYIASMRAQGLSDTEIARGLDMSTTDLRALNSIAKNYKKQEDIGTAQRLHDHGYSNMAVAERMGINESSVRALLAPGQKERADILKSTADMLRREVDEKTFVDVGSGNERTLGVSATKLNTALSMLKSEGYSVHNVKIDQMGTNHQTDTKVLTKPGMTQKDVWMNRNNIRLIQEHSEDGGRSFLGIQPPLVIDPKRLAIRYAEQGGTDADGVIYVRPGVKDVSLNGSRYAQVRVAVGDKHYLKGMAMYKDDLPDGVDLQFNTNKHDTGNKLDALKKQSDDADNPFGATIRQITERNAQGKEVVTSAMNIVNEEGRWSDWSKSLSSQMLSKQTPKLAETQLALTRQHRQAEFDEIMSLTNPAVRKKLLEGFADSTDSAAVHLKAAAMVGQGSHVILPINTLKETEIYAPNYRNGDSVVLIRYPHGGIFEIPTLTVNNNHPDAKKILGNAVDAVGINAKVAERLSGADFDGDTVLVIPNNHKAIKTSPPLAALKDFDAKSQYKNPPGVVFEGNTQQLMGGVSNLITDMTIGRANEAELARAVKHSMVVIDAEKHNLNYKQSAIDNGIGALKTKYQGSAKAGASTLISRARSKARVPEQVERSAKLGGRVDPVTGKIVYAPTGKKYTDANGNLVDRTTKVNKLSLTEDAHALSSGTKIEHIYAEHSNSLKTLANKARLEAVNTKPTPYSPAAKAAYSEEVTSLNDKLAKAYKNRPLERQAQVIANTTVSAKRAANRDMDKAELKRLKSQALAEARSRTGASKQQIKITPSEWAAIQAGAISNSKLRDILDNADLEVVKQLATPKVSVLMTTTKTARAQALLRSGATQAEVADALGVSLSTLKKSLEGGV